MRVIIRQNQHNKPTGCGETPPHQSRRRKNNAAAMPTKNRRLQIADLSIYLILSVTKNFSRKK
jgi:hypothetical protein